ncbi:cell wall protein DAN4 [Scaptodrosophila lebanonensis]|uniref:Cell wall protein DAN4 n=1 Tax=Drosophila lebanonensis TaxID=7225 RepID=A0A6J2UH48_DROLE|nr:cell wall protein DAN4 [Scaptodrosophila lebanonensis]
MTPDPLPASSSEAEPLVEARAQKQAPGEDQDNPDLDGRSAYVNNQYISNDSDEQNEPLYEILQKQMEQVLASNGPDVPIYAEPIPKDDKEKHQRLQQMPNKNIYAHINVAETEDYQEVEDTETDDATGDDEDSEPNYGYAEKPEVAVEDESLGEDSYQPLHMVNAALIPAKIMSTTPAPVTATQPTASASSTIVVPVSVRQSTTLRSRPLKRRSSTTTTTPVPKTTRTRTTVSNAKATTAPATTRNPAPSNVSTSFSLVKSKPNLKPISLSHDPLPNQQKRHIVFKTISTGSQFVNSPIGDLIIKFSIGFAKPTTPVSPSEESTAGIPANGSPTTMRADNVSEALRALSSNLLKTIEQQKAKRVHKAPRKVK